MTEPMSKEELKDIKEIVAFDTGAVDSLGISNKAARKLLDEIDWLKAEIEARDNPPDQTNVGATMRHAKEYYRPLMDKLADTGETDDGNEKV